MMLSQNYTAVAQTANLLAEWLIQAGNAVLLFLLLNLKISMHWFI